MTDLHSRWRKLCLRAKQRSVLLFLGYQEQGLDPFHWDGLWLRHEVDGTGIALSPALDLASAVWVLAHELGHEFTSNQNRLISPFYGAAAHVSTANHRKRWGQGRVIEPEENAANLWGAAELISPREWRTAETKFPGSFKAMAKWMNLPVEAAVWRAKVEKPSDGLGKIELNDFARTLLTKPVRGEGGPQAVLRRLQKSLQGRLLTLSHKEFCQARNYAHCLGGGWGEIFEAVVENVAEAVSTSGGFEHCFSTARHPNGRF